MRIERLTKRLARRKLSSEVAHAFATALVGVAEVDGPVDAEEQALIERLVPRSWQPQDQRAPFESLWQHADVFLTACLYIAVANGNYSVAQARHIGLLANRLGQSARQFSDLETRVMAELTLRGQHGGAPDDVVQME